MDKQRSLNYTIVLIYVITFVGIQLIGLFAPIVFPAMLEDNTVFMNVNAGLNLTWYVALTALLFYLAKVYLIDNQWVYFKSNKPRTFALMVVGFAAILIVNALVNTVMGGFGVDLDPENQAIIKDMTRAGAFATASLIIFAGFLAPISEEIVFRKGIYGLFEGRLGTIGAIIFSSFFFGFVHVMADLIMDTSEWINIIPYMAMGGVLAAVYYLSGKIIYIPIFIHMAYNLMALGLLFFAPDIM